MTPTLFRRLKYAALALAFMVPLAAGIVVLRFDPADFARQLVELTQKDRQRALRLEGDVRLIFFPGLGVEVGKCLLGGRGNAKPFAAFDQLRLELAWLPLLVRGEVVVKGVGLRGLRADLWREPGGATNFGDLLAGYDARWPRFALTRMNIENAEIRFRDDLAGHAYALHVDHGQALVSSKEIDLEAHGFGFGLNDLAVGMQFARPADKYANTLALALTGKHRADNFDLRLVAVNLQGAPEKFGAEKVSVVAQLGHGDDSLDAVLNLPAVAGSYDAAHAAEAMLEINRARKDGARSEKHSGAADLNLAKGWLEWPEAQTEVRLREPRKPEQATLRQGAARFDAASFISAPEN